MTIFFHNGDATCVFFLFVGWFYVSSYASGISGTLLTCVRKRHEALRHSLNSLVGLGKVGMEGKVPHCENPLLLQSELSWNHLYSFPHGWQAFRELLLPSAPGTKVFSLLLLYITHCLGICGRYTQGIVRLLTHAVCL